MTAGRLALLAITAALISCADSTPSDADMTDVGTYAVPEEVSADVQQDPEDANADGGEETSPPGSGRFIVDDEGAVLILRGINVDNHAKGAADRMPNLDADGIERIVSWGFNVVRFLIFWDAVEPESGQIDHAYLDAVEARVDALHEAGLQVVLDMHQDVYSRQFCCDGAPGWAVRDDGLAFELQSLWAANYYQPAVMRSFDNFWDHQGPHGDLQEHYRSMWVAVATRFAAHPGVLGYDLMNEPFPGSEFDPFEALTRTTPADGGPSRVFDETVLGPFYQRLIDAIREVDRDSYIFYESRYGAVANGSPCFLPRLDDPRPGGRRLAYAPHLYSVSAEASGSYSDDDGTLDAWEAERVVDATRMEVPIWLGEFGTAASFDGSERFIRSLAEVADRSQIGWAYWSWDPSGPTGWALWDSTTSEDNQMARLIARPYPRRIVGEPVSWSFSHETGRFEVRVTAPESASGEIEIWVGDTWYPNGWILDLSPSLPDEVAVADTEAGTLTVAFEGDLALTLSPSEAEE